MAERDPFHLQIEKVYKFLREIEKKSLRENGADPLSSFSDIQDFYQHPLVRDFLKITPRNKEEQKLQELIFHFKKGLTLQQFEFFLIPMERFLEKNLKDDDFVVFKTDQKSIQKQFPVHILLENIRSSFNVGSFFRLADGLGVRHIYLCGYTPHPAKTAMGAETSVPYTMETQTKHQIEKLKKENIRVVGLETTSISEVFTEPYSLEQPHCFVFGNERFGLNQETLRQCDEIRQIPMFGTKNSMNVAVCGGIVISEWLRQYQERSHEH